MLKKITCILSALVLLFSLTVYADKEFLVYKQDDIELLCAALDMNADDISDFCKENNITYFAVNHDNTKQIRRAEFSDAFSEKVVDLSVLSDDRILKLSDSLSGFENTKGEIVNRNGLKFLKLELKTEDGGGEYVLTQYITVSDGEKTVLSFYSDADVDRGYIQAVFEEQFPKETNYEPFIIIGLIVFAFVGVVAAVLIVKELRKKEE